MLDKNKSAEICQISTASGSRKIGFHITHYTIDGQAHLGKIAAAQGPLVVVPPLA